jgi:hypothetical protein
MNTVYIWDNGQVVTLAMFDVESFNSASPNRRFIHKFIVDSSDDLPSQRYGYMKQDEEIAHWRHVPKEMFPKEFLTHLLLLGVT